MKNDRYGNDESNEIAIVAGIPVAILIVLPALLFASTFVSMGYEIVPSWLKNYIVFIAAGFALLCFVTERMQDLLAFLILLFFPATWSILSLPENSNIGTLFAYGVVFYLVCYAVFALLMLTNIFPTLRGKS